MSLKGAMIVSPTKGVCLVTDFDKATGLFYILPPIGQGKWVSTHDFTVLWINDVIMFHSASGIDQLGVVTHLDFDDWTVEVVNAEGEYGYPLSGNVTCVVGRDMPTLTTAQQGRVSANLIKLFTDKIMNFVQRLPVRAGGR